MKNAFKNQFKMIEIRGQIYGLLVCGSHDENVFVFLVREGCFGWLGVKFIGFSWKSNGHFISEMNAKSWKMKLK